MLDVLVGMTDAEAEAFIRAVPAGEWPNVWVLAAVIDTSESGAIGGILVIAVFN